MCIRDRYNQHRYAIITFYLPGMVPGVGAFAYVNYSDRRDVFVPDWSLEDYQDYIDMLQ